MFQRQVEFRVTCRTDSESVLLELSLLKSVNKRPLVRRAFLRLRKVNFILPFDHGKFSIGNLFS